VNIFPANYLKAAQIRSIYWCGDQLPMEESGERDRLSAPPGNAKLLFSTNVICTDSIVIQDFKEPRIGLTDVEVNAISARTISTKHTIEALLTIEFYGPPPSYLVYLSSIRVLVLEVHNE